MPYKAAVKGCFKRRNWKSFNDMAERPHKGDVLDQQAISAFIRQLSPRPEGLVTATGLSYGTVEKWYRPKPSEMSAANLLRVVFALGAEDRFVNQILAWRAAIGQTADANGDRPYSLPVVNQERRVAERRAPALPSSAIKQRAKADPSAKKKERGR